MLQIKNKQDCCGCTACASVCPCGAISMQPDVLGFLYPHIDASKCIDCGLCDNICSFHKENNDAKHIRPIVYGGRHTDSEQVKRSRSGAAFVAISDYVFSRKGVVYGAGYDGQFRVIHKRATDAKERDEFRGSKYVQSDLRGIFPSVKNDLEAGKLVLFTGTPCQVAGLDNYIDKSLRDNLILVDIVCYGVPGPTIWQDYLLYLKAKEDDEIVGVNFRDKEKHGWSSQVEAITFKNKGTKYYTHYASLFGSGLAMRESCGICPYANTQRPSDLTLGDFWGVEKINAQINQDNKGVSLILCNTSKGQAVFQQISSEMDCFLCDTDCFLQPRLMAPTKVNPQRDAFEKYYEQHGLKEAMEQFRIVGWKAEFDETKNFFRKNIDRQNRRITKILHKLLSIVK